MMYAFIRLMNSPGGRLGRIVLGAVMFTFGLRRGGIVGTIIAVASLVPMVPAFFGRCA